MAPFTFKLILLVFILTSQRISSVSCQINPENLPVISVDLEQDVSSSSFRSIRSTKTFKFVGESVILFPEFTELNLTCRANYLIRWDSTIKVKRYELPKKFVSGHADRKGELPSNFQYESTITLQVSVDTAGSVACMKLGDRRNSSELLIHGEITEVTISSQRKPVSIRAVRYDITCPKDQYGNYTNWREINSNPNFTKLWLSGILIKSGLSSLRGLDFCRGAHAVYFTYPYLTDDGHTLKEMYTITDFLNQRVPDCVTGSCYHWNCSNPFHCNIAEKTTGPKSFCNEPFGSGLQKCNSPSPHPNTSLKIYVISGFNELSTTPQHPPSRHPSFQKNDLMRLSTPNMDAIFAKEPSRFTCSCVSFLLSKQIVFGVQFHNRSIIYMNNFSKDDLGKTDTNDGNLFTKTTDLSLEPETKSVICMAPRFDSEEWYNISMEITVRSHDETTTLDETETTGDHINITISWHSGNPDDREQTQAYSETVTQQPLTTPMDKGTNPTSTPPIYKENATETSVTNLLFPKLEEKKRGKTEDSKATVIGAVVAVLLVLCLIAGIYCGRRYVNSNRGCRELTEQEIEEFRDGKHRASVIRNRVSLGFNAQLVPFQNEIPETDVQIEESNRIAQDAFMSVYPATIKGRKAIVKVTNEKTTTLFFKELLKDVKVMNHISLSSQPNIVQFLGAITHNIRKRTICVGFESSNLGSLKDFLRNNSACCVNLMGRDHAVRYDAKAMHPNDGDLNVTTLTMLQWAHQISLAMSFVQSENLVHGNLTASNVILFAGNLIKISDLSAWRKAYERDYYLANYKPPPRWRWMAIELIRSKKFTIKSDVWAFGVTLWEIFSGGEDPHPGIKWSPDFVLKLEKGYRMDRPSFANQEIYQALLRCWYCYPKDRFDFFQVKERIRDCMRRFQ